MILDYLDIERRGNVAVIWLDEKDRPVNTLNPRALDALEQAMEEVEHDSGLVAAVIASRKSGTFVAGADLDVLATAETPEEAAALSRRGHLMIRRVESSEKPLVAAVHGAAIGGGLELALACTYRVATDSRATRFQLPEVQLGLLPAGGGTQLLPRLVGLQEALPMLLAAKTVFPRKAKRIGLVDMLTHEHNLIHAAVRAAEDLAAGRLESGRSKGLRERVLEGTPIGRRVIYRKALAEVEKETRGNYPAPPLILECVRVGMEQGRDRGFEAESRHFGELVFTTEHRALVGIFRAKQKGDKNPYKGAREVGSIGVLGAGLMGGGIAQVSAEKGIDVRMKDADFEAAAKGKQAIWKGLRRKVDRKQYTAFEADTILERVVPVENYDDLAHADVVIEAVPEDIGLKRRVLAAVEEVIREDAIFATNTSSIPIAEVAAEAKRPERVVGMHYFSPVPQRPLLEVIRQENTPEDVLATVCDLGLRQGKTLIVVRDGPGFYTTRILAVFLNEALLMLEEGADAEVVDGALKDWGFPMGPFELMDFVGLDVAAKVTPVFTERMAERKLPTSTVAVRMVQAGRLGQKSRRGFYHYDGKGSRPERERFDRAVYSVFGGEQRRETNRAGTQDRLGLLMVNEAVRCLDEGILASATDGDLGAVFGLGFPPFRGGPFMMVDQAGADAIVARLERLAERHGTRFDPAAGLRERAASGERFRG
jgi:3-hydroxyacyl-CoA dehydrogenase / enoyl-CoA hydratase / 3-hydroxybutyryl-CoA epimerase